MLPLIGNFEQDGYSLDMGKAGKMSLGKTTGRGFAAKVGPEPLLGEVISQLAAASEELEKKDGDKAGGSDAKPAGRATPTSASACPCSRCSTCSNTAAARLATSS